MLQRRKFIRYDTQGTVIIKSGGKASAVVKADLINVSFLGCALRSQEKIAVGTKVDFKLTAKLWSGMICGKGIIRNAQQIKQYDSRVFFRIGIEFIKVDEKAIRYFLNRILANIQAEERKRRQAKKPTKRTWL